MALRNDSILVSGDDEGTIKLWDLRKQSCVFQWSEHEDFISDIAINEEKNILLAASGDGCLSALHMRKGTVEGSSITNRLKRKMM